MKDLGRKFKGLAVFLLVTGIIGSVIYAIAIWSTPIEVVRSGYYGTYTDTVANPTGLRDGLIVLIVGCLSSYFVSWCMDSIGEIAEHIDIVERKHFELKRKISEYLETTGQGSQPGSLSALSSAPKTLKKECPHCGALNNPKNTACFACGKTFTTGQGSQPASPAVPRHMPQATQKTKKECPHCGARNNVSNTECFACGKPFDS